MSRRGDDWFVMFTLLGVIASMSAGFTLVEGNLVLDGVRAILLTGLGWLAVLFGVITFLTFEEGWEVLE